MTQPAAEPKETMAGSSSPTSSPERVNLTRLTGPPLGVRPTPSPTTSTDQPSATGSEHAAAGPPSDPLDETGTTRSASEPPPADAEPLKLGRNELRDTARGLVLAAALGLHHVLARYPAEQEAGLWVMADEHEAAGIADPLASIARRYSGGALVDATTSDLIRAGIAAAGYVAKNGVQAVRIRLALRRVRRAGLNIEPEEPAA